MNSSTNVKVSLALSGVILAVIIGFIVTAVLQAPSSPSAADAGSAGDAVPAPVSVLQPDTHILDDAGEGAVVVVEFLDFECEACGAFYPVVEDLREEFEGDVTFAFRYFPLPGHVNSTNAALAVEAAAQQGELEAMYDLMYETQAEWGESQDSKAELFRGYASNLGLDLAAYDAAVAAPETLERVNSDFEAGVALGVQSTPTFFVNNRPLELRSLDDLRTAIEGELDR